MSFEKIKSEYTREGFGSVCNKARVVMRSPTHVMISHYGYNIAKRIDQHPYFITLTTPSRLFEEVVVEAFGEQGIELFEKVKKTGTMLIDGGGKVLPLPNDTIRKNFNEKTRQNGTQWEEAEGYATECCRQCGKGLTPYLTSLEVYYDNPDDPRWPTDAASAQRLTNGRVVRVDPTEDGDRVGVIWTWDSHSYHDPYFCDDKCGAAFARRVVSAHEENSVTPTVEPMVPPNGETVTVDRPTTMKRTVGDDKPQREVQLFTADGKLFRI